MNVDALTLDVGYAHKDFCLHTEQHPDHSSSQSVLACAGLGDKLCFAHIFCEQPLAERVVHFVCAAVKQVFTFEIYLKACILAESFCKIKGRGSACVVFQETLQFFVKGRIFAESQKCLFEFLQRRYKDFGNVKASVISESAFVFHIFIPLKQKEF